MRTARLGDALEFAGRPERIQQPARERFITLRLKCGGAVQRVIKDGKVPVPFTGYRVAPGQFIYSRIDARNGAFGIVPGDLGGAVVSKDFPVFHIREDRLDPGYLLHFLRTGRLEGQIRAASYGATNRQRIAEDVLLGFPVPLPPLPEQRRIATILDHADALCAKRRQVLAHLDALTMSIFHDMFSDGESGEFRLADVGEWHSGGTPPRTQPHYFDGSVPWFSSGELGSTYVVDSLEHINDSALRETTVKCVPAGSVMVGMYDTAALKSSIAVADSSCNQAIAFALPDPKIADTLFVYHAIQSRRPSALGLRRGIRQKNLNLSMVREILIPHAPIDLQREFSVRATRVADARATATAMLAADGELFTSLQARAFDGRL